LKVGFNTAQIRLRHVKVWGAEQPTSESVTTEAYLVVNRPGNQPNQLCALRDSGGRNRRPCVGWAFSPIDRTRIIGTQELVAETSGSYWEWSGWIRGKGDEPPAFSKPGRIIVDWEPMPAGCWADEVEAEDPEFNKLCPHTGPELLGCGHSWLCATCTDTKWCDSCVQDGKPGSRLLDVKEKDAEHAEAVGSAGNGDEDQTD
jgi:hypothetical protein